MVAKVSYADGWNTWFVTFYDEHLNQIGNSEYFYFKKDCIEYGKEVLQKNANGGTLEVYTKQDKLQKVVEF